MDNVRAINEGSFPNVPGYRLLRPIGKGGMADVYLAIQQIFERKVALKIFPSSGGEEQFRQRFLREAKIVAQLSHPHIIAVHDVGEIAGYYYLAMDYLPGDSLKDLIRNGLSVKQGLGIVKQIAEALDFAHGKGFVHRDVKPDNVLFRDDGNAVLTDFGIANDSDGAMDITQPGLVVGTPNYMSPEQARGDSVDSRSDIYSLGIMFYEMLTHRIPYQAPDPFALALKHVNDPLPRLPEELAILQPIMDGLLAKSPDERYQSGQEFISDLEEINEWDIAYIENFDATDYYRSEDEDAGIEEAESYDDDVAIGNTTSLGEISNYKSKSSNPFSQRDFVGLLISFFLLLAIAIGALMVFAPDVLNDLPYYQELKSKLELYLNIAEN